MDLFFHFLHQLPCWLWVFLGVVTEAVPQKFMRPKAFARRIGVSARSVYLWITQRTLPSHKFNGVLLIDVQEADEAIKGTRRNEVKRPVVNRTRRVKIVEGTDE